MTWQRFEISASANKVPMGQMMVPEVFVGHFSDFDDGGPNVDVKWQVVDGTPVCREVRHFAVDAEREVQRSDLNGLSLETLLEQTMKGLRWNGDVRHDGESSDWPSGTAMRQSVREVRRARRERKVKVTDDLLRQVAEIYRDNVGAEPTQAVADHFGKQPRTARLYVQRARAAGFLGEAIPGKAGER